MATALDCEDVVRGEEAIERSKYVLLPDGTTAKRIVIVTGGDALTCADAEMGLRTLRFMGTVKVGPGQFADQVVT